ncbi:glycine betaine/L-proline transporter ProP [Zophobihabitans entericus]|uniref:Glycine betaine/L-proline transporter ProP n=1 Tax=Zophobihabitans entericus TaxID=1635327 RepID=A0A6G9I8S4_9GAMM|nr:glycine betaine/L-proline transporter ProP [Zophobihabitans entericus]QIQ20615.1 glycine betaine/L-proline transporter ProP [Zophobihabitans entericus]
MELQSADTQNNGIGIDDITIIDEQKLKKAVVAASLGNAMEWFDFGIYGFVAITLGHVFFPGASGGLQVIATLATFAVAFLARPLGGLFFGRLGDKYGRHKVLSVTIIIMAVSTFCIGLIPSYQSIGFLAPLLLIIARIAQGFSTGGEYCGALIFVAEYSPDRKRGFMGSWLDFGSIAGFLCGAGFVSLLSVMLTSEQMVDWGWRIPFLFAGPLGLLGFYLRHQLDETPTFQQHLDNQSNNEDNSDDFEPAKVPLKELFTTYWRSILKCLGLVIVMNVTYYTLLTYMPNYLSYNLNYSQDHGVLLIIVIMISMLFMQPIIGILSDKFGRRPIIITGCIGLFLLAVPCFYLITTGSVVNIFIGLFILAIFLNLFTGSMGSTLPALFPTNVRYSALAVSFNIAVSFFCGTTPLILAWLTEASHNLLMPGFYLMIAAIIGMVAILTTRESANRPLKGSLPAASNEEEAQELLEEHYEYIEQRVGAIEEKIEELQEKREELVSQHPYLS